VGCRRGYGGRVVVLGVWLGARLNISMPGSELKGH
jgi:hypothetical protein